MGGEEPTQVVEDGGDRVGAVQDVCGGVRQYRVGGRLDEALGGGSDGEAGPVGHDHLGVGRGVAGFGARVGQGVQVGGGQSAGAGPGTVKKGGDPHRFPGMDFRGRRGECAHLREQSPVHRDTEVLGAEQTERLDS